MTFPKLSGFIHFSKTFPGLENAVLKFHDFSRFFMTVQTLLLYLTKVHNTERNAISHDSTCSTGPFISSVLNDIWVNDVTLLLCVHMV